MTLAQQYSFIVQRLVFFITYLITSVILKQINVSVYVSLAFSHCDCLYLISDNNIVSAVLSHVKMFTFQKVPRRQRTWPNVFSMLGQRRRRWPNIETTLGQVLVFAGQLLTPTQTYTLVAGDITYFICIISHDIIFNTFKLFKMFYIVKSHPYILVFYHNFLKKMFTAIF